MDLREYFEEHKNLYLLDFKEGRVLFRILVHNESAAVRYLMNSYPQFKFDLEDDIWEKCVLEHTFPVGHDFIDAGIVTTVAQAILSISQPASMDDANTVLANCRIQIQDAYEQAVLTICEAFPSYLPEDIEKMSWPTVLKRLAQAEHILKKDFAFKNGASQHQDDSARIFDRLDEYTNETLDIDKLNRDLHQEEYGSPVGDFNLKNIRGS